MNDDKFNLWRATFALVHLDGKVTKQEVEWAKERLKSLPLTDEQKHILVADFKAKKGLEHFLEAVTNKADRAFLLHQVRVISNMDGEYSTEEKEFFKSLEAKIMNGINLDPLVNEVVRMEKEDYREDKVYSVDNEHSFFEQMAMGFLRFINSGDYKRPGKADKE